jgi:sporulation integral membrane protein YlbJ
MGKNMKLFKNMKNKLIKGSVLLFLIAMVIYPHAAYEGASSGLLLWFHNVLPALLPFIIVSNFIIRLNITSQLCRVFYPVIGRLFKVSKDGCYPIILGFFSGIPMGAKSTADLILEHKISPEEGRFLFTMCNNASPMFIIGYAAITQLKLPPIKYALFVIIYGSAMISALLCRAFTERFIRNRGRRELSAASLPAAAEPAAAVKKSAKISFDIVDSSIMNGFEVITKVGGYIILFSILAQIIKEIGPDISYLKACVMGIFEFTTGISQICSTGMDLHTKIVLVAAITSFGGFSGMAQTKSVIGDTRLSMIYYFVAKLHSAGIACLLALLYVGIFPV